MARLNIQSPRIRSLIEQRIAPLYLAHGNIAALTKALNDALATSGSQGTLHPNRLHALLSDDVSRGINDATATLIEQAAVLAMDADTSLQMRAAEALQHLRAEVSQLHTFSGVDAAAISQQTGVPAGVVSLALDASGSSSSSSTAVAPQGQAQTTDGPDWSYQDAAVRQCLDAYGRRPNGRIGLVLPTGAGKTRTALRIVLAMLAKCADENALAYWVTHRRNLREQANRELQKLIAAGHELLAPERLVSLCNRIRFVMTSDLPDLVEHAHDAPALIVVDEAHHAAAPSYTPVFDNRWSAPVLLLTATPNRGDRLPIGIDEIAFTITYRELAQRRAVLTPQFIDLPVPDFDWSEQAVSDLADFVLEGTADSFTKVLVLAPRVERVEEFYAALLQGHGVDHPISPEDIGFIHGSGNSLGIDNEDFLTRFLAKPRGIIVSAQLLLEGFDDPSINTVVLTYPSSSVIRLMQAAGRCVRYSPEKLTAYVVQAKNTNLAYHFDQRWLYQDIDDSLRPQLIDIEYVSVGQLREKAEQVLRAHRLDEASCERVLRELGALAPGDTCRLFLYGLPYYGSAEQFEYASKWAVAVESPRTSVALRGAFNGFCELGADLSDPSDYLGAVFQQYGLEKALKTGSLWMESMGLLTAAFFAGQEIRGFNGAPGSGLRNFVEHGATTWLKYVTFSFRPSIPAPLNDFWDDCHNKEALEGLYREASQDYAATVKVPLPLGGHEGFLLDAEAWTFLQADIETLRLELATLPPQHHFGALASHLASAMSPKLPPRLFQRLEALLNPALLTLRSLSLD